MSSDLKRAAVSLLCLRTDGIAHMCTELPVNMIKLLIFVWRARTHAQGLAHVEHMSCLSGLLVDLFRVFVMDAILS